MPAITRREVIVRVEGVDDLDGITPEQLDTWEADVALSLSRARHGKHYAKKLLRVIKNIRSGQSEARTALANLDNVEVG